MPRRASTACASRCSRSATRPMSISAPPARPSTSGSRRSAPRARPTASTSISTSPSRPRSLDRGRAGQARAGEPPALGHRRARRLQGAAPEARDDDEPPSTPRTRSPAEIAALVNLNGTGSTRGDLARRARDRRRAGLRVRAGRCHRRCARERSAAGRRAGRGGRARRRHGARAATDEPARHDDAVAAHDRGLTPSSRQHVDVAELAEPSASPSTPRTGS